MIDVMIQEAKARTQARKEEAARRERERIAGIIEEWLGTEGANALDLAGKPGSWVFTVGGGWWRRPITIQAAFGYPGQKVLEVRRNGDWGTSRTVRSGDELLVAIGELR